MMVTWIITLLWYGHLLYICIYSRFCFIFLFFTSLHFIFHLYFPFPTTHNTIYALNRLKSVGFYHKHKYILILWTLYGNCTLCTYVCLWATPDLTPTSSPVRKIQPNIVLLRVVLRCVALGTATMLTVIVWFELDLPNNHIQFPMLGEIYLVAHIIRMYLMRNIKCNESMRRNSGEYMEWQVIA